MFSIKATYRGHTRKHTFSDTNTFPTYDQICNQLHRVFPFTQNYYLSNLLFSPDATQSSRILLSKEVHNTFDYNKSIRQFKHRTWPHALLRFTVLHEVPRNSYPEVFGPTSSNMSGSGRSMPVPQQPAVQMPMDNTEFLMTQSSHRSNTYIHPQHTAVSMPQHHSSTQATICCSVSQGMAEVKAMLHNFQQDLNRVMAINFHEPLPSRSSRPSSPAHVGPTSAPPPFLCSSCTQHRQGTWYSCNDCHVVVCEACFDPARPGFCLSVMGPHQMKFAPSPNSESYVPIPRLPFPWTPRSEASDTTEILNTPHVPTSASTQTKENSSTAPSPVIHKGVTCDVCNKIIEGVRHKCLDCPDYDLCTPCMAAGVSEFHNPFHEFLDINQPGRVIVHTVFSRNGERESRDATITRAPPEASVAPATEESTVHFANCDLCDSRIRGDRYKCLNCPDFDTCASCFSITTEQHPDHTFVKIKKKEDFIRRLNKTHTKHNANCNSCSRRISGFRFKCMHPECPDYDLCEDCEAFPIAVHPSNHPMLKMKTADTVIPTVYRVGQTNVIEPTTVNNQGQTLIDTSTESTPSMPPPPVPSAPAHVIPIPAIPAPPPLHAPAHIIPIPAIPAPPPLHAPVHVIPIPVIPAPPPLHASAYDIPIPAIPAPPPLHAPECKPASIASDSASAVDSPLSGQALLNRPISSGSTTSLYPRSLAELIHQLPALIPSQIPSLEKLPEATETHQALTAKFVDDITVPEGQAFPPGAEFVKCWRLLNTSQRDWPENTELVFVAGDRLSDSTLPPVLIGQVAAGAEFDVWTGELKAPDIPGRYVGYWRMKANGELFGNRLWIEINVVESDSHHTSDESMAASSIIMPAASPCAQPSEQHAPSSVVHSLSASSTTVTDGDISEIGSDGSSVSLISMPSSPSDDEDEVLFHDSRSQTTAERAATAASGIDYVMLYDDNSSSEE